MADTKISALTELTSVAPGDWLPVVDTSAVTTKKYQTHYTYTGTSGSELQTLLTAANTAGGGIVECPITGTITSTTKITIPENVTLQLNPGLVITSSSDIDMIELAFNGRLDGNGATISNTNASYSGAIITLDASVQNFDYKGNVTQISDVILKGHANEPSTGSIGLHLYASSSGVNRAIQACIFNNIRYWQLNIAIREEVVGNGNVNYVNGNLHDGIVIDDCTRGLVQSTSGTGTLGTWGNQYRNFNVQAGTSMEDAIVVVGKGNQFDGLIWDWQVASGTYSINSSANLSSEPNIFSFPSTLASQVNLGSFDILYAGNSAPVRIQSLALANLPDASSWKYGLVAIRDIGYKGLAWSTGSVWATTLPGIVNTPTSTELTSTFARTLTSDELGRGVAWTSNGATSPFTFTLPANSNRGSEVIIYTGGQVTTISPTGDNFVDNAGSDRSGATPVFLGTSSSQDLQVPANCWVHLKSYNGAEWTIVASRGDLNYV